MHKNIISKYNKLSSQYKTKKTEFENSIKPLKDEVDSLNTSICSHFEKVLENISNMCDKVYGKYRWSMNTEAHFGILSDDISDITDCKLEYISEINDIYINFHAFDRCNDGYISIPIDYIDMDLKGDVWLTNKYIMNIFDKIEQAEKDREIKELQEEIEITKKQIEARKKDLLELEKNLEDKLKAI